MHKGYLLLRNNKQSGPFSHEELIQQTLMPHDLVWVEGRSAGWQYPTEIDSLKAFVKTPVQGKPEASTRLSGGSAELTPASTTSIITGKHIYVSMPSGSRINTPEQTITDKLVIEQRKDAFEKKAEELYNRAQAFQQYSMVSEDADTQLNTKYNKSLDDLKQEYSSWMHSEISKTGNRSKRIGTAAALLTVIAFAILAGIYFFRNESSPVLLDENNEIAENSFTPVLEKENVERSEKTPVSKKSIPLKKTSAKATARKTSLPTTNLKNKVIQPAVPTKKEEASVPLPQLVGIKGRYKPVGKGVSASEITVSNNSNETLRVVAVDVVYYTVEGSIAGRKTIYFNDLLPRESMTLSAPSNKKAEEVRYTLGLISSKEGGIYYAMQ